jgi:hypoxanthine phosphoribosyltransferase
MLRIEKNKLKLSWDDISHLVDDLCQKIPLELPLIDSVHGIARGGLIPAVMISHKLDLPYVNVIGKNTLVIDDIADSGVTLEKAPGVYTAVLHYKPHTSCFKPNLWSELHEGDEWLIYPWEMYNAKPMQDYLQSEEFLEFAEREDNSVVWSEEDSKLHTIGGLTNDKEGSFMEFQNKINKNG